MKAVLAALLALIVLSPVLARSPKEKKPEQDPVQWGMLGRAEGCVIFKETKKTNFKFYGVAATEKIYAVLDVIETERYDMAQKHWTEDQDGMNQLQRLATSERLTYVKIQDGYSPALLDKDRGICAGTLAPASPESGTGLGSN